MPAPLHPNRGTPVSWAARLTGLEPMSNSISPLCRCSGCDASLLGPRGKDPTLRQASGHKPFKKPVGLLLKRAAQSLRLQPCKVREGGGHVRELSAEHPTGHFLDSMLMEIKGPILSGFVQAV